MLGWELPPHNSGGLGVACLQLCKALAHKGVDIEFVLPYTAEHNVDFMKITPAHPQDVREVLKAGIAYDSFAYINDDGSTEWIDMFGQSKIYEHAVEQIAVMGEYDVIHAHDWLTCRAALRAKEITGLPLIVHIHSVEADRAGREFGGNPIVREIEEQALLLADRVIAVSQHTKNAITREYGIPADKIDVVHNSFDPSELIEVSGENDYQYLSMLRQNGYKVISNIGRMTIQKGLTHLLRAFQLVVAQEPKTMLLVAGSGDQYYELVGLSAELGIAKNVVFAGFQRGKRYRDTFTVADLFVLPSVSEPFGISPLEAIGYGTPVLISKQSGVSETLNNVLKVDFWDTKDMANKMLAVVQNDSLGSELSINAEREYQRFTWGDAAERFMQFYEQHTRELTV